VETRVFTALDVRLRAGSGLTLGQLELLRFVDEHPRARVADVAVGFAIGVGATSKIVDRLERRGWLERAPNPDDRRSSLLVLTDDGRAAVAAAVPVFDAGVAELLAPADDPDAEAAARFLARARDRLEQERIGLPAG